MAFSVIGKFRGLRREGLSRAEYQSQPAPLGAVEGAAGYQALDFRAVEDHSGSAAGFQIPFGRAAAIACGEIRIPYALAQECCAGSQHLDGNGDGEKPRKSAP